MRRCSSSRLFWEHESKQNRLQQQLRDDAKTVLCTQTHTQIAERSDCKLENLPPSFWLNSSFVSALRICVRGVGLAGANFMAVAVSRILNAQPELRRKAPELVNLVAHLREFFLYNR